MLQLRRRRLWIALSTILLAAVFFVCLQPGFGPTAPAGFDKLEHLADDPYNAGWLVKIRISDESGLAQLLDHAAYQKQCEEEMADE